MVLPTFVVVYPVVYPAGVITRQQKLHLLPNPSRKSTFCLKYLKLHVAYLYENVQPIVTGAPQPKYHNSDNTTVSKREKSGFL